MIPTNNKIVVRVDLGQKDTLKIGDTIISTALKYETNYRYSSPTVAEVVEGNNFVKSGDILLVHHNLLYLPSPFHLENDLFSIPFSRVLFAKVDKQGYLDPICGNMICEEIQIESELELPTELKTVHINRYNVVLPGWTLFKKGDIVFTKPHSGYGIIYHFNEVQTRAIKVDSEMVCGVLNKKQPSK